MKQAFYTLIFFLSFQPMLALSQCCALDIFNVEPTSQQKIFLDKTNVRAQPNLASKILDVLPLATNVKILTKDTQFNIIKGIGANWALVEYTKNDSLRQGYVFLANLALGYRTHQDTLFLVGIQEKNSIKKDSFHYKNYEAILYALDKNKKIITQTKFDVGSSYNLARVQFNIARYNPLLDKVQLVLEIIVSGDACGIPTLKQYAFWTNQNFVLYQYEIEKSPIVFTNLLLSVK